MEIPALLRRLWSLESVRILAAEIMLGIFIGYIFFYDIFNYYSAPFNNELPSWALLILLGIAGLLIGYLFPDLRITLASAVALPLLGAFFCFLIFISPLLSPDIISTNISDDIFIFARLVLVDILLSFLVIFTASFVSLYFFDENYELDDAS